MHLNQICLRNFRNYKELNVSFAPGVNLLIGDNAQGKTNLLEAIGYLGSGKSFRTQKGNELVALGAEFCLIEGEVYAQERTQTVQWTVF